MRNFTTEDFSGCGQYLVYNRKERNKYTDTSFLTTMMKKVGYCLGQGTTHRGQGNVYTLVDMSDGLTKLGYFDTTKDVNLGKNSGMPAQPDLWVWVPFDSVHALCDYLNNPDHTEEMRFATQEEVVRVVMHQKSRWR